MKKPVHTKGATGFGARGGAGGRVVSLVASLVAALTLAVGGAFLGAPQVAQAYDADPNAPTVDLYDYTASGYNGGINAGHSLKFVQEVGLGIAGKSINAWTGSGKGAYTNMVENTLDENGNPVLNPNLVTGQGSSSREELDYLFPDSAGQGVNAVHKGVSGLFHNDNGYFVYDSADNFASYQQGSNSFNVLDHARFPKASNPNGVHPSFPQFLPFNRLTGNVRRIYKGTVFANGYNLAGGNDKANYHFGMKMVTDFFMPEGGKVNGQDMVFDFRGDDDVWVYVDGVLVLDIGGIHDATKGEINFATGKVSVEQQNSTTLDNLFRAAGKTWDATPYKTHTLSFFYLERGTGGSNCRLKFNMPTIPAGTLEFGKQVDYSKLDHETTSDINFKFNAFVNADGKATSKGPDFKRFEGSYDVYDSNTRQLITENNTATNGVITLKDGQYALLKSSDDIKIARNSKFYLREIGVTNETYDVKITGTDIDQGSYETEGYETAIQTVHSASHIVFHNAVQRDNVFNLKVAKKAGNKGVDANTSFNMKVMVGDKVYAGAYDLYDTDNESNSSLSTDNGIIALKPGQYAMITGLVGGNTVKVYEVKGDGGAFLGDDTYRGPSYEISPKAAEEGAVASSRELKDDNNNLVGVEATAHEGKALGGKGAEIDATVTNYAKPTLDYKLTATKTLNGINADANKFNFTLTPADVDSASKIEGATANQAIPFSSPELVDGQKTDVRTDTLHFTEADVSKTFTYAYAEAQDQALTSGGYILDQRQWKAELAVGYKEGSNNNELAVTKKISVSNDGGKTWAEAKDADTVDFVNEYKKYSLQITKQDDSNNPLSGATFTLTGPAPSAASTNETTGDNGVAMFEGLLPGTYTLVESKVPAGYQKLPGSYQLVIKSDGTAELTKGDEGDGSLIGELSKEGDTFKVTITNKANKPLPTTGGIGNVPLFVGGMALVAGAVTLAAKLRNN